MFNATKKQTAWELYQKRLRGKPLWAKIISPHPSWHYQNAQNILMATRANEDATIAALLDNSISAKERIGFMTYACGTSGDCRAESNRYHEYIIEKAYQKANGSIHPEIDRLYTWYCNVHGWRIPSLLRQL